MYEFAVVVLLGLATLKFVDLLFELIPGFGRFRSVLTLGLAVLGVYALDYSVFAGFGIAVREAWLGTLFTGLVVGATAHAWTALFAWLGTPAAGTAPAGIHKERPRVAA